MVIALPCAAACGKKGPPLAPLVRIPAAVETIEAVRVGRDVYVTLTIPTQNVDEHSPADVDRVEIYGYTGPGAPPRGRFAEFGQRIAVIPVAPPPTEGESREAAEPEPEIQPPAQGASITIRDTLVQSPRSELPTRTGILNTRSEPAVGVGTPNRDSEQVRRFYTAYAFSPRNRPGPPGEVAELPLLPVPDAPPVVDATYDARQVTLRWEPAGGLIGYLLERPLPEEPPPIDVEPPAATAPSGPLLYNVYRATMADPLGPPEAAPEPWEAAPPEAINPVPLARLTFTDPVEFGVGRCYTVRAVRGAGADATIGEASPAACVTPVDTFPPAAPRSLAAVATEGAISLIWEPAAERDLAGYLILRGDAPGDTLQPLTPMPVPDARYRDDAVTPGARYVYAVVAVDRRFPVPNVSAESNRVEESAR